MRVRRPPQNVSFTTQAFLTKLVRFTTVLPPWTGWSKSRNQYYTITSAATKAAWQWRGTDFTFNIIDTWVTLTFTVEVNRSLALMVWFSLFCAVSGVEPQFETNWRLVDNYKVPRIGFVNKMDRSGANFFEVVKDVKDKLGTLAILFKFQLEKKKGSRWLTWSQVKAIIWNEADWVWLTKKYRYRRFGSCCSRVERKLLNHCWVRWNFDGEILRRSKLNRTGRNGSSHPCSGLWFQIYTHDVWFCLKIRCTSRIGCSLFFLPSPLDVPPVKGTNPKTDKEEIRRADVTIRLRHWHSK